MFFFSIFGENLDKCQRVTGRRVLMNYADAGCCHLAQQRNCESGLQRGGFDLCVAYSNWSIDDAPFVSRNCDLLSEKLWLFKPYLVNQALQALDDGDVLFYADSGSEFVDNVDTSLICLQDELRQDVVVFSLDYPEYRCAIYIFFALIILNFKFLNFPFYSVFYHNTNLASIKFFIILGSPKKTLSC